jgi:glycosyltransferase involved in cell wall biosynthesis
MKVTIITATYNSAATVADTLRSVQDQKYPKIEHIIIDGRSKDNTLEIIGQFGHVKQVISEPDKGIYDAMNKGISFSTGDIIGILNSDDFYTTDDIISKVAAQFQVDSELDCVYGDLLYVDQKDSNKIVRVWKSGSYSKNSFLYGWMPPHPTFFVRKEVYQQYGLFNLDLGTAADYELMLRFLHKKKCKCAYIPEFLIKMRSGGASNQTLKARLNANKQDRTAWKVNGIRPRMYTLIFKPFRKIFQYMH